MKKKWTKEELETYCFRCEVKTIMKNPYKRKREAGIRGECLSCGKKVFKVLH